MVGGRAYCQSCFVTLGAVVLLGFCLPDVEASSCQRTIDKKVGDTVELSSCLSLEEIKRVTLAKWRKKDKIVADRDVVVDKTVVEPEFRDRFSLNPTNFSLTVRNLTPQDSGIYSFISEENDKQRETVYITLQVHEPITKGPDLTGNSTWNVTSKSCLVLLECSSTYDSKVNYSWSVRNQTQSGSRLQFTIRPEDGETTFTCTISDFISERSTSKTVKCSNSTESQTEQEKLFVILAAAIGGCVIIVIVVGIAVAVCHCKRKTAGTDSNDLTVYADVNENGTSTIKPCSVYETIDDRVHPGMTTIPVTTGPQTVYDKIQLNRVRKPSSPYQEI